MSLFVLYRKNGGEVLGASKHADAYTSVDPVYFGMLIDPAFPDGVDIGVRKFAIPIGNTVRNATQIEMDNWPVAEAADDNLAARVKAKLAFTDDPQMRKILRAFASIVLDEINTLRQNPTTVYSARTMTQLLNAISAKIDAGNYD